MDRFGPKPLTKLVEAQHGVVTRAQLAEMSVSAAAIDSRARRGALRRLYRGVYAVGHTALRDEGRWLAAVLACGPGAVLSHHSAARLWGMWLRDEDRRVHLTTTRDIRHPGLVVHRTLHLTRADVTVERGVPVTTPARTIVDLADVLTYEQLRALADRGVRLNRGAACA